MGHIFISYSRADIQAIDQLAVTLKEAAIEVWIDREGIDGGAKWRSQIVNAIKAASAFVIALSPDSVKSENVRKELAIAETAKKPIVPIVLRATTIPTDLEYTLVELQRIDLVASHSAGVKRLLRALRELGGSSAMPVQVPGEPSEENQASIVSEDTITMPDFDHRFSASPEPPKQVSHRDFLGRLRDRPKFTFQALVAERRAILLDQALSIDERMRAFSALFPTTATLSDRTRAINDDPILSAEQKAGVIILLFNAENAKKAKKK